MTLRRALLLATVLFWLALFAATHAPPRRLPQVHISDKAEHFAAYGLLTLLLSSYAASSRHKGARNDWMIIAIVLAYGAVDEWTQALVGRDCELLDWFADSGGAGAAVAVFGLARWWWTRRTVIRIAPPVAVATTQPDSAAK